MFLCYLTGRANASYALVSTSNASVHSHRESNQIPNTFRGTQPPGFSLKWKPDRRAETESEAENTAWTDKEPLGFIDPKRQINAGFKRRALRRWVTSWALRPKAVLQKTKLGLFFPPGSENSNVRSCQDLFTLRENSWEVLTGPSLRSTRHIRKVSPSFATFLHRCLPHLSLGDCTVFWSSLATSCSEPLCCPFLNLRTLLQISDQSWSTDTG